MFVQNVATATVDQSNTRYSERVLTVRTAGIGTLFGEQDKIFAKRSDKVIHHCDIADSQLTV